MLHEAGFHPLEVMQAATMNGAITLPNQKARPRISASFAPACWPTW